MEEKSSAKMGDKGYYLIWRCTAIAESTTILPISFSVILGVFARVLLLFGSNQTLYSFSIKPLSRGFAIKERMRKSNLSAEWKLEKGGIFAFT